MKMVKSLLLGSAAGVVAVVGAQAADLPVKAKPVEYVKICSLYGDGFFYIPGTDTCVRVGGAVMADHYYNALGNGHAHFDSSQGAQDRTVSSWSQGKVRVDIAWDARTQTAYGTLRTFLQLRIDNTDDPSTNTLNEPRGYIQWAGFTFGHTRSYSDPFATWGGGDGFGSLIQGITHPDSGANGTNQLAYTWELGNGMVAIVGIEQRRNNSLTNLSNAASVTLGNAPTSSREGMKAPDPYVAFRMSQAWGNFSAALHLSNNDALYYTGVPGAGTGCQAGAQSGTTQCAHPSDKMGWAILTGLQINLPMIAPGDRIGGYFTYGEGATKYAGGQNLPGAGLFGTNNQVAVGVVTDGVYVNGGGIQLTTGWAVGAAYEHWWTPQFKSTIFGSHAEFSYNANVVNSRMFCGGGGGGVQTYTVAGVCDPGFKYSDVRFQTMWIPAPGFRLAAEVGLVMIDTAFNGQVITIAKTQGARPTGAYAARNQDLWVFALRAQRGFGTQSGE